MARRLMKNDPSPTIPYEEWGFFSWADKDERTVEEVLQCWIHELTRELILRGMLVPEPLKVLVFSGELPQRAFLDTDENPRDTVRIKFATPTDARNTVSKVKRISKPFARKIQILTVLEQRAKVAGKSKPANIAKRGKEAIRRKHGKTKSTTSKR